MASKASFDVMTGADLQEVDNAVNNAMKEVRQRYDFKGTKCTIEFDRKGAAIKLDADDDFKMKALYDVLQTKLVQRKVPIKNLQAGEIEQAGGGRVRRVATLTQAIPDDTARTIVKAIKAQGFKKVQVAIQGGELRVSAPSRDAAQEVIAFLRGEDYGIELRYGNFRS